MRNVVGQEHGETGLFHPEINDKNYRTLIELCPDALIVHDGDVIVLANMAMAHLVGVDSVREIVGCRVLDFVALSSRTLVEERIRHMHNAKSQPLADETWMRADGSEMEVEVATRHTPWIAPRAAMVIARDVTRQRRLQAERETLLAEKELLIREVHHRVANNLQLVQGLLKLQARGAEDDAVRSQLWEASARIGTIGSLHARLQKETSAVEGDVRAYLEGVIADLRIALGETGDRQILLDISNVKNLVVRADLLVALGLIVAEAVINSAKHGSGHVRVRLTEGDACLELMVEDDGAGFPTGFDPMGDGTGLGMRMMTSLVQTHGGTIVIGAAHGELAPSPSRILTTLPL